MPDLDPPESLKPGSESRRIWLSTVEQLLAAGQVQRVSPDALLAYVTQVAVHRKATELIEQTQILVNRDGRPVPNPALDIQRQAALVIERFTRQFRLNRPAPMQPASPVQQGRWCADHQRYECTRNRKRNPGYCHSPAVIGYDACRMHVGKNLGADAAHILAVEHRRNPLGGEPMDIGPAEALLWRVRKLAGEVAELDKTVAALERDELVWGTVSEETVDTGDGPAVKTVKAARLNVWLTLRSQRETMLQGACEAALRANIEERIVRMAEQEGAVIHRLLVSVFGDLAASGLLSVAASDERVHAIAATRLRELTA